MSTASVTDGKGTVLFGGSGFLGPCILERCPEMISVGRNPPVTPNRHIHIDTLADLRALHGIEFDKVIFIIGNTDHHTLEKEQLDLDEPNAYDYHLLPLLRAMEQLKHRKLTKFIHFSSILIYDEKRITLPVSEHAPINPYRNRYVLSKYLAEEACKFFAQWIPIINCRFCNLYGPTPLERYDLIHLLARKLLREGKAEIWSAAPERDFIYADDAAEAIIRLLDCDYTGTLNLGSGAMTSVGRIVEIFRELTGCEISVLDRPVPGPMKFVADMTTINRIIDWQPRISIEEGVQRVYEKTREWMSQERSASACSGSA
jgi:nucleoside-diphosphate-sugar epimerase